MCRFRAVTLHLAFLANTIECTVWSDGCVTDKALEALCPQYLKNAYRKVYRGEADKGPSSSSSSSSSSYTVQKPLLEYTRTVVEVQTSRRRQKLKALLKDTHTVQVKAL